MRPAVRITGTLLLGAGVLLLAWIVVVWKWQDPFTALYTTYQQHRLAAGYAQRVAAYKPLPAPTTAAGAKPALRPGAANPEKEAAKPGRQHVTAWSQIVSAEARRYRLSLREGDPVGRIKVPRMGIDSVLVSGTDHSSLTKGPGWYRGSFLPGEGQLIYIAGHRTTYLAPFAHIDRMQPGDLVTLEVPYGTFVYRVTGHVIVPADDVERLQSHDREVIALQACHPRFFATHRYIVYARPVRVFPRGGPPYVPKTGTAIRPSA